MFILMNWLFMMIIYPSASDFDCRKLHDWLPCRIWPRKARIGMEEIWLSVFIFFSWLLCSSIYCFIYWNFVIIHLWAFMPKKQMVTLWALKQVTTLRIIMMPSQQDHAHTQMCLLLLLQGLVITLPLIQLENPNTTLRGQLHHHLHIVAILHFQLSSDFLYCVLFIFYSHSFVWTSGSLW